MNRVITKYIMLLAVAASLMVLHSCSGDVNSPDGDKCALQLVSYGVSRKDDVSKTKATRALLDGYDKYSDLYPNTDTDEEISVLLVNENKEQTTGTFTHVKGENRWTSDINVGYNSNYHVFGFMPKALATEVSVTSADYTRGATMTVRGLKAIMADDVCVVVGVKSGTDKDQDIADSGIVPGEYLLITSEKETEYIHLLFDHICSCMALQFLVDADYNNLRTIKIKKVKLQALSGPASADATITLPCGNPASDMSISWTTQGTDGMTVDNLLSGSESITLSTGIQEVPCYITPRTAFTFNLTTEYDVYDKKGNLIRENCRATNKVTSPQLETGKKHPIKMKVQPTYLYQLSEPDLDNPTIVLE